MLQTIDPLSTSDRLQILVLLPSQLFHCLSSIIAARLRASEQLLVAVCELVIAGVVGAAADEEAVGLLAGEAARCKAVAMDELVLLEDVPGTRLSVNSTRKSRLGEHSSPTERAALRCDITFN